MAIKYINSLHCNALQNVPNWDILVYFGLPSGNPAREDSKEKAL
jgi:hypothetical protein